jgi:hypothetical protein
VSLFVFFICFNSDSRLLCTNRTWLDSTSNKMRSRSFAALSEQPTRVRFKEGGIDKAQSPWRQDLSSLAVRSHPKSTRLRTLAAGIALAQATGVSHQGACGVAGGHSVKGRAGAISFQVGAEEAGPLAGARLSGQPRHPAALAMDYIGLCRKLIFGDTEVLRQVLRDGDHEAPSSVRSSLWPPAAGCASTSR